MREGEMRREGGGRKGGGEDYLLQSFTLPSLLHEYQNCCEMAIPSGSHLTTLGLSKKMTSLWISSVTSMGGKALSGSGSSVISGGYVNFCNPSWSIFLK